MGLISFQVLYLNKRSLDNAEPMHNPLKIEEQWETTRVIDQFNRFPGSMGTRKVTLVANGSQYRDAGIPREFASKFSEIASSVSRFSVSPYLSLSLPLRF